MLKNKVIFILSLMKFDALPSTNLTVAKYLAQHNEVYYIEHPFTLKDYIKLNRNSNRYLIRKKAFNFFSNGLLNKKIDGLNLLVCNPILPTNFLPKGFLYKIFSKINEKIVLRRIKRIINEKQINNYIFINFYDFQFPSLANYLNPDLKIYYCVDPISDYHKKHGISDELMLVKNSDLIICTSKSLYEEKKLVNSNCYFVPNASDLVTQIDVNNLTFHPKIESIKKTIIGYIGAIERRIDYNLLEQVILNNPALNFVFVGPRQDAYIPEWFFHQHNIYFINAIPSNEIADMIYSFDICLIPFKKNETSKSIFPLKLFEYLAIGKPVIITNFNEDLEKVTGKTVTYIDSVKSFNDAIINYMSEGNNKCLKEQRINLSMQNTWESRIETLNKIIETNLNNSI